MTPSKQFIEALKKGFVPDAIEMQTICYELHMAMINADMPELQWIEPSFEDMGDTVYKAIQCVKDNE